LTLEERLLKRFRGVGVTPEEAADWVAEAEEESGLVTGDDSRSDNALLYLAYAIGCTVIATDAARYFRYTDAEEAVDKTMVSAQYLKLAAAARKEYTRQLNGGFGAYMTTPGRADGR